jgi:hypothetical protein
VRGAAFSYSTRGRFPRSGVFWNGRVSLTWLLFHIDDLDMVVLNFQHLIKPQQTEERDDVYGLHHQPLKRPAPVGTIIQLAILLSSSP